MAGDSALSQLDALLVEILSGWNVYSTAIATTIGLYLAYLLFSSQDPDVHPALLARQAVEAPVRLPGESATFRARDVPHGYPLKSGLGVKDPDTPKWTSGRNGDLRDIWRAAARGAYNEEMKTYRRGTIYKVAGDKVDECSLDDVSQQINILGQYIRDSGAHTVAICLSDSVEFLGALFAGAFYGFQTVIIPHDLPSDQLNGYLRQAGADLLIAEAGAVEISAICGAKTKIKTIIWVTRQGNDHMEWGDTPREVAGKINVAVWHELVRDNGDKVGSEVPPLDTTIPLHPLKTLWGPGKFMEYTQQHLVAGVAALGASFPHGERLTCDDILLSTDSLARSYPLCLTLAALYANASIVLNSVGGEHVDFSLATMGAVTPTIIISSSHTISDHHAQYMKPQLGPLSRLGLLLQRRFLDNGIMPTRNLLSRLLLTPIPTQFSRLRFLCISHRADGNARNMLTDKQLTDLRIFTGARTLYALTAANVAGAVCQTHAYDYRRSLGPSHFGQPLSCVEIKLIGHTENKGLSSREGEIICSGPSVIGGSCNLGVRGKFRDDNTLVLLA